LKNKLETEFLNITSGMADASIGEDVTPTLNKNTGVVTPTLEMMTSKDYSNLRDSLKYNQSKSP